MSKLLDGTQIRENLENFDTDEKRLGYMIYLMLGHFSGEYVLDDKTFYAMRFFALGIADPERTHIKRGAWDESEPTE